MPNTTRPHPDLILAHVRLLDLTDELLTKADELREARETFQTLLANRGDTDRQQEASHAAS